MTTEPRQTWASTRPVAAMYGLDDDLAAYWSRCCEGKVPMYAGHARRIVGRSIERGHSTIEAYRCPFSYLHPDQPWHVGHPLPMVTLVEVAALLRARSGNAPSTPGSGTTKRQRRKARRQR